MYDCFDYSQLNGRLKDDAIGHKTEANVFDLDRKVHFCTGYWANVIISRHPETA